jgi:four helix bundle protein
MGHSYRDLIAWQKSMDLVESTYRLTRTFPREEVYGLVSQMRCAAVSVPSNIAEGQGRMSCGEFRQFLGHARGSLLELETQSVDS